MLSPTVQAGRPPGSNDDGRDAGRGPSNRLPITANITIKGATLMSVGTW